MFYPFPKFEEWFILSLEKMKFLCKYVLILLPKLVESCLAHWALAALLFWRKSEVCKQGVGGREREKKPLVTLLLFLNESLINIPSVPSTSISTVGSLNKNELLLFWNRLMFSYNQAYWNLMMELLVNLEGNANFYLYSAQHYMTALWRTGCPVFLPSQLIRLDCSC